MLILVLLALVWIVALTPMVMRRLRDRERMRTGYSTGPRHFTGGSLGTDLGAISWGAGNLAGTAGTHVAPGSPGAPALSIDPVHVVSRTTAMRRRRVVTVLVGATLVTFALGFGLPAFFYLAVTGLVLSTTYLALLVYFHRVAVERAQKVVALETRREAAMALDEARQHSSAIGVTEANPPRFSGTGWAVRDSDFQHRRLASAGQ